MLANRCFSIYVTYFSRGFIRKTVFSPERKKSACRKASAAFSIISEKSVEAFRYTSSSEGVPHTILALHSKPRPLISLSTKLSMLILKALFPRVTFWLATKVVIQGITYLRGVQGHFAQRKQIHCAQYLKLVWGRYTFAVEGCPINLMAS